MNESDLRSDVHYLGSSENKAWKKLGLKKIQACTGFEPMTSAIPVQRSTNWELVMMVVLNKPVKWWIEYDLHIFLTVQIESLSCNRRFVDDWM